MSTAPMTDEDIAGLSDDELMNMPAPPPRPAEEEETPQVEEEAETSADPVEEPAEAAGSDALAQEDEAEGDAEPTAEAGEADDEDPEAEADPDAPGAPDEADAGDVEQDPQAKKKDPADDKAEKPEPSAEDDAKKKDEDATPIDYKAAYEKIMAPFKAAGKMVQLQSPEEVVQLMQMGAHYTKKMQALQPHLKKIRMLENNDLLDEGKLSFLIDLSRKDPAAIQKLVRDSGLDPLEIDTSSEPEYRPGNHKVTDEEMRFTSTLEEVSSDPTGKELILSINNTWDTGSKQALWDDPNLLRLLSEQKNSGVYDQITSEIERRKTLGLLRDEPFLAAYKTVGEELHNKGALTPRSSTTQPAASPTPDQGQGGNPAAERRIVETRPANHRKTVSNHERAKAASATRTAPKKKPAADFNPLALSDEDFEKTNALAMKL